MSPFDPIPGETPIDDVSGLIPPIGLRTELNQYEANNVTKAILRHLIAGTDEPAFDLVWMRQVHRDMFGEVWRWAGTFRTSQTTIGIEPRQIEVSLYQLCLGIRYFPIPPSLSDVAYLHHELVRIHPFPNGNGRWARLVSNIFQRRNLGTLTDWPSDLASETEWTSPIRAEYIASLREADRGFSQPLIELHRRWTVPYPG